MVRRLVTGQAGFTVSIRRAEGHGYVGFFGCFYFEHWLRSHVHEAGNECVRHLLDADIKGIHGVVVELAAVGAGFPDP